ncbi:unnamed protein product [Urochloa humidicola]
MAAAIRSSFPDAGSVLAVSVVRLSSVAARVRVVDGGSSLLERHWNPYSCHGLDPYEQLYNQMPNAQDLRH